MGFLEVLTIIFITLKLTGTGVVATWGWAWILAPIWLGYPIIIVFWIAILAIFVGD